MRRMVQASSRPGDWVLDFFAGSGTLGAVARASGRRFVLVDSNPEAIEVMRRRLGTDRVEFRDAAELAEPISRERSRTSPWSPDSAPDIARQFT